MTRRDVPSWLPFVLLAGVLLVLFHRLLSGQALFWGLPSLQFYPWRHYAFEQLGAGRLPTWNPYLGAGAPLLANYQSAIFYPPNWLFFLLPDPQAMSAVALLHVIWAGAGMWLFTGALGLDSFGRSFSTLAYALSGYLIGRFGSFPTADSGAWLPWIFWLAHRVMTRQNRRDLGGLALTFGMQLLSGHAQTTWYSACGVALYALWVSGWEMRPSPMRRRITAILFCAGGALLGVGMAAVQLIPTAEYFLESQRSGGLDYETVTNLSYSPFRLVTLFNPNFYGTPADGSYITKGIYFEDAAYIGVLPLIAAIAAGVAWVRHRRALGQHPVLTTAPFWIGLALVALLIATGRYGPFFRPLYTHVPTFDWFREPVRWLILTVFSLSVLAGIGTEYWGRGKWVVFWSRLATAGGGALVMMALVARQFIETDSENLRVLNEGMIVLGCWAAVAALFTLAQPQSGAAVSASLWRATVLIFVAVDLAWAGNGLNPTVPDDFYRPALTSFTDGRMYWFAEAEHDAKFEEFFVLTDYRQARDAWPAVRASLLPNLNMLDGILMLNNFDPFLPHYTSRYIKLIEQLGTQAGSLLQAAGVNRVKGETPAGWRFENGWAVSPDETPLAWLVPQVEWYRSDRDIETALLNPAWDPAQMVFLHGVSSPIRLNGSGTVSVLENRPDRRRYRVAAEGAAMLVMSHAWYPGWQAEIDGEPVELYRANLAFQAVLVPPGGGDVTVRYQLNHGQWAVGITLLAVLVTISLVALGSRTRRVSAQPG